MRTCHNRQPKAGVPPAVQSLRLHLKRPLHFTGQTAASGGRSRGRVKFRLLAFPWPWEKRRRAAAVQEAAALAQPLPNMREFPGARQTFVLSTLSGKNRTNHGKPMRFMGSGEVHFWTRIGAMNPCVRAAVGFPASGGLISSEGPPNGGTPTGL